MLIVAMGNNGSNLSAAVIARMPAYRYSKFNVTVGQEYTVYAMALWVDGIIIMILDDLARPHWYPVELFRVTDSALPANWSFGFSQKGEGDLDLRAFWGYRSLIVDPGHHAALIDRKISALRVFLNECYSAQLPTDERQKFERLRAITAELPTAALAP